MDFTAQDIEGLLLSAFLGALIGIDREYRGKAAGFRTLMLVSLGSATFTMVSFKMAILDPNKSSDVTRIAASIVSGIGFLGAGIIFRIGQDVRGITTAATVWMAAAIGMAAGIGNFTLAILSTVLTLVTLFLFHYLELILQKRIFVERYIISYKTTDGKIIDYKEFFTEGRVRLKETKIKRHHDEITVEWLVSGSKKAHDDALQAMLQDTRLISVEH